MTPTSAWSYPPPKRGGPEPQYACISKHLNNANGLTIGKVSDNSILDTRMYNVEYADGKNSALSTNLITENMFKQIDKEGNYHIPMDKITDYRFDEAAVKSQDAFVTTSSGIKRRCHQHKE